MPKQRGTKTPTEGERLAVNQAQAEGGSGRPVEGVAERTADVNPDNAPDTTSRTPSEAAPARGASEQGGMAGPVGYFEGEGNEGPLAPLGGDPAKSAEDGAANSQGGVASGAPG